MILIGDSVVRGIIYLRDILKKHGQHEESKNLRNAINSQKRAAKKKHIQDLLSDKNNSESTWSAIHQLTNKASLSKPQVNYNISVDQLNDHFSTVAGKILTKNSTGNNTLDKLQQFCQSHNIQDKLEIPLLTVTDVYYALKHLKQSGKRDLDGLDTKILKLAAPLITDTLTYVYNLCIMKNTFPSALKKQRSFPYTNLVTVQTLQTIDQFLFYLSCQNHSRNTSTNTCSCT